MDLDAPKLVEFFIGSGLLGVFKKALDLLSPYLWPYPVITVEGLRWWFVDAVVRCLCESDVARLPMVKSG